MDGDTRCSSSTSLGCTRVTHCLGESTTSYIPLPRPALTGRVLGCRSGGETSGSSANTPMLPVKVVVFGSGSFGTALGTLVARNGHHGERLRYTRQCCRSVVFSSHRHTGLSRVQTLRVAPRYRAAPTPERKHITSLEAYTGLAPASHSPGRSSGSVLASPLARYTSSRYTSRYRAPRPAPPLNAAAMSSSCGGTRCPASRTTCTS
jgi:hypothetical protein